MLVQNRMRMKNHFPPFQNPPKVCDHTKVPSLLSFSLSPVYRQGVVTVSNLLVPLDVYYIRALH